jgi:hypothetical protein
MERGDLQFYTVIVCLLLYRVCLAKQAGLWQLYYSCVAFARERRGFRIFCVLLFFTVWFIVLHRISLMPLTEDARATGNEFFLHGIYLALPMFVFIHSAFKNL